MGYRGRMWSLFFVVVFSVLWQAIEWLASGGFMHFFLLSLVLFVVESGVAWLFGWQFDRLEYLARFDLITGILNRHYGVKMVLKVMRKSQKTGKPCSILVIDGNQLKRINDTQGHLVGDQAIQAIAATIRRVLPKNGFVARLGGDEFLCVLPEMELNIAGVFSDILANSVANATAGRAYAISVSVGHAVFPEDGTDFHALMRTADGRMYAEKDVFRGTSKYKRNADYSAAHAETLID